jgi:hypothetical protein
MRRHRRELGPESLYFGVSPEGPATEYLTFAKVHVAA